MSEAMDEIYNEAFAHVPEEMLQMIAKRHRPLTIRERSAEAVKRIFEAVDEDRRVREN
ncbi:hypothetical protein [Phyllobacterium sp. P5_D12]